MNNRSQVGTASEVPSSLPSNTSVALKVNGANCTLQIEPRVSLLDALREYLGLTGTKKGCNQGACGACTVLCDGERILSCLSLAVQYEGREITTVEGLANDGKAPSAAGCVHRTRWLPVRILYARPDLFRSRHDP